MKCHLSTMLALILLLCLAAPLHAADPPKSFYDMGNWHIYGDGPHYLDLGAGIFNFNGSGDTSAAARIELRFGSKLWFVGPAIGIMANLDGGYYGYGGIYADIAWKKLFFTPLLSAGAYEDGASKDLGGTFQFRSALEISYQFDNLTRLGVQVAHISNADLHERNPGEEEIFLTLAVPF